MGGWIPVSLEKCSVHVSGGFLKKVWIGSEWVVGALSRLKKKKKNLTLQSPYISAEKTKIMTNNGTSQTPLVFKLFLQ